MDNRYGDFAEGGREYVITTPRTPRPWYNYFWNDEYISFTSQVGQGEGFAQDPMGRRIQLLADRALYLLDEETGDLWTAHALPLTKEISGYRCEHGLGYTTIRQSRQGVETSWRMFVPEGLRGEVWSLTVRNTRCTAACVKVFPYVRTALDGPFRPQGYFMATAHYDEVGEMILGRHCAEFSSSHEVCPFLAMSEPPDGFDCREFSFVGDYGDKLAPQALLENGGCTNSRAVCEKLCLALEKRLRLEPGQDVTVHMVAGVALSPEEAREAKRKALAPGAVAAAFDAARDTFLRQVDGVRIETPDTALDPLFNYWLKHQANMGSRWARVRHNGYRDMSSDCDCLAHVNPDLAWERIVRVLSYQYSNGYAPRTFLDGAIIDRNFSDNTVWPTFAVYTSVMESGRFDRLGQDVPFNDGSTASVYEHLRRALDWLWRFRGENGLIRIWGGDWNDCLERVGPQGKGTSVWLSQAWARANGQFADLARQLGRDADVHLAAERGEQMARTVNDVAWAGEYYLRAFTDAGQRIGAPECEEGRIFLNPQLWGIMSGTTPPDRAALAMAAVDRLLDTPLGSRISWPAYTRRLADIGHMSEKHAGVNENGGVYLHTCAWKIAADAMRKRHDKAAEELAKIIPGNNTWFDKQCEPYVACNCYFPEDADYLHGSSGQSWRTGAGGWIMKAVIHYLLGIQATPAGLRLDPCLPPGWKHCAVEKAFRGATYRIEYRNEGGAPEPTVRTIRINGQIIKGAVLPCVPGQHYGVDVAMG